MLTALNWASRSVKRRGFLETVKVAQSVLIDLFFDYRYGTDTMRWVEVKALGFESEHKTNAVRYTATKSRPLSLLMRQLSLPTDGAFVDLGSGKGRVLLIASQFGFLHVVGVEFCPELCSIARENIEIFDSKVRWPGGYIKVVCSDVATFLVEAFYNVFYMYNPFDKVVMVRLLANLHTSVARFPRKIWLIYNTPIHDQLVSQSGLFSESREYEIDGTKFKVYNN
jgi:SAM-dependent methyltransferase